MGYIGVTAAHISRQVSGRSKFGFDGGHNDLTDLVVPHIVPVLVSSASCSSSACESMSASHHTGGRSCCPSTNDGAL